MSNPTVLAQSGLTGTNPVAISAPLTGLDDRHDLLLPGGGDQPDGAGVGSIASFTTRDDRRHHDHRSSVPRPNPSNVGQAVTFTATVTVPQGAGVPTGTVTFLDGMTVFGTGTLNGADLATFSTSTLAAGDHLITAVYGGDDSFAASIPT